MRKGVTLTDAPNGKTLVATPGDDTFELGNREADSLRAMEGDGAGINEIAKAGNYSLEEALELVKAFQTIGVVEDGKMGLKWLSKWKMPVVCPDDFLSRKAAKLLCFALFGVCVVTCSIAVAMVCFDSLAFQYLQSNLVAAPLSPFGSIIAAFMMLILASVFHEMAHAVVARACGASVPQAGFMLLYLIPSLYTDLRNLRYLCRSKRILALAAGSICDVWLLASVAIGVVAIKPIDPSPFIDFILLQSTMILFNLLNVFFKFDGYLILRELVNDGELRKSPSAIIASLRLKSSNPIDLVFDITFNICSVLFLPVIVAAGLLSIVQILF